MGRSEEKISGLGNSGYLHQHDTVAAHQQRRELPVLGNGAEKIAEVFGPTGDDDNSVEAPVGGRSPTADIEIRRHGSARPAFPRPMKMPASRCFCAMKAVASGGVSGRDRECAPGRPDSSIGIDDRDRADLRQRLDIRQKSVQPVIMLDPVPIQPAKAVVDPRQHQRIGFERSERMLVELAGIDHHPLLGLDLRSRKFCQAAIARSSNGTAREAARSRCKGQVRPREGRAWIVFAPLSIRRRYHDHLSKCPSAVPGRCGVETPVRQLSGLDDSCHPRLPGHRGRRRAAVFTTVAKPSASRSASRTLQSPSLPPPRPSLRRNRDRRSLIRVPPSGARSAAAAPLLL